MKLSIITCTYNSQSYLQECIDSVVAQNLDKDMYEHVFIDGFSTDGTGDIIKKYIEKHPDTTIVFKQKEAKGIYNAMNEGIKSAKGKYILCLNSDDYLSKDCLSSYLNFIAVTGDLDVYFSKIKLFSAQKDTVKIVPHYSFVTKIAFYRFGFNSLIYHPGVILKKSLFDRFGYFNEKFKIVSDVEFRTKLNKHGVKFTFFDHVVSCFRMHEGSATGGSGAQNKARGLQEYKQIRQQYYGKYFGWFLYLITKYTT